MQFKQTIFAALIAGCVLGVQAQDSSSGQAQQIPTPEQVKKEARANTKYLAAEALKKAKAILDTHGEFAPFGAGLFPGGDVNFVWALKPGESTKGVDPVVVLNAVRTALTGQAQNGRILGSAVVYQYKKEHGADSQPQINVEVEYLNGYAEVIGTEYKETDSGIEYTKSGSREYEAVMFTDANNGEAGQQ